MKSLFVTVGSQLPFDRLIIAVDEWAQQHSDCRVFAQIGFSRYRPNFMRYQATLSPSEYREALMKADLIVAHAGMGTIISALELGKPLLLMPRLAEKKEHRNDHQLATVTHLVKKFTQIEVAENTDKLKKKLDIFFNTETQSEPKSLFFSVSPELIHVIRSFIADESDQ